MQVIQDLSALSEGAEFDVVVVGAGGAGMGAALFAALDGARVLLVESTPYVGGTTALSAGTTWVPCSLHSAKVNPSDTLAHAALYLDSAVGTRSPAALRQAFLHAGPQAIERLERDTDVKFRPYPKHPDYISDLPGATLNGRALEPLPFDGRLLGHLFKLIRTPIPEFTVLGGMMVDRTDINHLLAMTRSWASLKHSVRIVLRHLSDRLRYPRGTRLVMGNALIARLLYSLSKQSSVSLLPNTRVEQFGHSAQGVDSVVLSSQGLQRRVRATRGVVLASGGFNRHPQLRQQMLPGIHIQWCPGAPGHTGQAHELAQDLGAQYGHNDLTHAFWAPVSLRQRSDGSTAAFPHFVMDRAKPGMVTVNQAGERFVNESTSYHLFGLAMQQANPHSPAIPAYLIADATALRQYGMGMVRPGGKGLEPFLKDGYLTQAGSIAELAQALNMDAATLQATVANMNAYAQSGTDPQFQRGVTAYQQNLGDPNRGGKNPNLGPIDTAPYYAVRLYPGDIGACTGFVTNGHAQVLDAQQRVISGLYAVGNDMNSIMGGVYTAPGITIGPGLVFAYLASQAQQSR